MNSIVALLVNLPTMFILYLMTYYTQSLSGKRQFYGVSLNSDYFTREEFKSLDKGYKKLITIGFVISLVILLISIYVFKAYEFASIFPILAYCLYIFGVYVYTYKKVMAVKKELALNISDIDLPKTKIAFDTDFINKKNKIIKRYSIIYLVPNLVVLLLGVYILAKYNSIPNIIPTHWGPSGVADAFCEKSVIKVLSQVIMSVGLCLIIYLSSIYSLRSRIKLNTENLEYSKKLSLYFLNRIGFTFLLLNISMCVIFFETLLGLYTGNNISPAILWISTFVMIVASIYLVYIYYRASIKTKDSAYSTDDDDSVWILGCIYNNPNDPSLFVQKRFGVGWTINVASTKGKLFFASPFILIIISLVLIIM